MFSSVNAATSAIGTENCSSLEFWSGRLEQDAKAVLGNFLLLSRFDRFYFHIWAKRKIPFTCFLTLSANPGMWTGFL